MAITLLINTAVVKTKALWEISQPTTQLQLLPCDSVVPPAPPRGKRSHSSPIFYEVRPKNRCIDFYHSVDSHGIVHKEFLPPRQTAKHAFYKDVFEGLQKQLQRV
jgi:hypothetical protein